MFNCDETVYIGYTDAELSEAATYFAQLELAREWRAANERAKASRIAQDRRTVALAGMLASVIRAASEARHEPFPLTRRVIDTVGIEIANDCEKVLKVG